MKEGKVKKGGLKPTPKTKKPKFNPSGKKYKMKKTVLPKVDISKLKRLEEGIPDSKPKRGRPSKKSIPFKQEIKEQIPRKRRTKKEMELARNPKPIVIEKPVEIKKPEIQKEPKPFTGFSGVQKEPIDFPFNNVKQLKELVNILKASKFTHWSFSLNIREERELTGHELIMKSDFSYLNYSVYGLVKSDDSLFSSDSLKFDYENSKNCLKKTFNSQTFTGASKEALLIKEMVKTFLKRR